MSENMSEVQTTNIEITKKKSKTGLIIGIIASVIAVIGIALFLIFFVVGSDTRKVNKKIELAEKYLTDLDFDNAILAYKEAIAIDPKNENAYLGLAEAYRVAINHYETKEDYGKAIEYADDAIEDMKDGVIKTNSDEIRKALDEFKDKKDELIKKNEGIDQEDEKENVTEEKTSEEESVIPDSSEVAEIEIPDVEIPFEDWGTHDNPVLNQYLESLGYTWVTEDTVNPEALFPLGDGNQGGVWTMSKDYGILYSIYYGQTGLMDHPTTPICFYIGFTDQQEYYYWEEIAYDSEKLLKVAKKHAQMFPEFQKYFDERGFASTWDEVNNEMIVEDEYYELQNEFYVFCASQ